MKNTTSKESPSAMEKILKADEGNLILHCSSLGKTDPSTLSLLVKVTEDLIYLGRYEEALVKDGGTL